jgi:sulfur-carrier protein
MQVKVKLFASLREYAPAPRLAGIPFEMELPAGSSLEDLLACLKIPSGSARVMFVNGIIQSSDIKLKAGDEVGIFPPIGGGLI